jgi:hypothetical protein
MPIRFSHPRAPVNWQSGFIGLFSVSPSAGGARAACHRDVPVVRRQPWSPASLSVQRSSLLLFVIHQQHRTPSLCIVSRAKRIFKTSTRRSPGARRQKGCSACWLLLSSKSGASILRRQSTIVAAYLNLFSSIHHPILVATAALTSTYVE